MRSSGRPTGASDAGEKITPYASDSARLEKGSDWGTRTFAILAIGTGGMACLISLLPAAGHDQMWCLYAARLMLHGAKLYGPELFESNPPLIMWLSMIPSALANWVHLPDTFVGKLLVAGIEVCVAGMCLRMLRVLYPDLPKRVFCVLAFVYVAVFAVMPARDFGQRDHILALLCLPYIFAAALYTEGRPMPGWKAAWVGLAAGIGIALKPHEALIAVAVEAMLLILLRRRWKTGSRSPLRPEPLCIVAFGMTYLVAIQWFAPDYFTRVIPTLRATYWAFGHLSWLELISESIQLHLLGALTVAGLTAFGWRRAPAIVSLLVAAGIAGTLAYYLQGTGWYYQQLPALSFFALALTFLAIEAGKELRFKTPAWAPWMAAMLCLLALGLTAHFTEYPFTAERSFPIDTPDPTFFAGLARGTPVATLTTTVDYTVPPAFKYGLTLAQRYPHLWMLPAILRGEAGDPRIAFQQLAQLQEFQHTAMLEDFVRWQPKLVLVERCQDPAVHCQVLEDRHDDLLAWFLRDPDFRKFFAHYHFLRSSGSFDAYVPD